MTLLEAALKYAGLGWPVFPIWWPENGGCACGKPDCSKPGKHLLGKLVPRGRNNATMDPEIIMGWWKKYPQARVAIVTGPESGLLAVDVDPCNGDDGSWKKITAEVDTLPLTPTSRTGGGGWHHALQYHGNTIKSAALSEYPGIDIKSKGGGSCVPACWPGSSGVDMITVESIRQALQCKHPSCACHRPNGHVHCPAHADSTPSLSVAEKDGKILVYCHGGCPQDQVLSALKKQGLWPSGNGSGHTPPRKKELVATFGYKDATGTLLFEVCRFRNPDGSKTFSQRRPIPGGGFIWGLRAGEYQCFDNSANWCPVGVPRGQKGAGHHGHIEGHSGSTACLVQTPGTPGGGPGGPGALGRGGEGC